MHYATPQFLFDRDRAAKVVLWWARFEFALVIAGYRNAENGMAKACRGSFAAKYSKKFSACILQSGPIAYSYDTFKNYPVSVWTVEDGNLVWRKRKEAKGSLLENILDSVWQVRNNCAHGGKYHETDPAMISKSNVLMDAACIAIEWSAVQDKLVKDAFEDFA
jgi:hypothetical protein